MLWINKDAVDRRGGWKLTKRLWNEMRDSGTISARDRQRQRLWRSVFSLFSQATAIAKTRVAVRNSGELGNRAGVLTRVMREDGSGAKNLWLDPFLVELSILG
jgi:hypothetical protein